ncbi:hypothetical protein [Halobellus sp. H-GB7]|nr:hypothetical protein [Halobellus sp. H-GB7]MDQ2053262.1 hypothetical protein [Halobellus sp. H-GB7]
MSSTEGHPADGGPWWCPSCGRVTVTNYRCSNWDCAVDLTEETLEAL